MAIARIPHRFVDAAGAAAFALLRAGGSLAEAVDVATAVIAAGPVSISAPVRA